MALDPSIALGVRPIELPNQLAQYGQLATIQNAQNQNALAQYQLSSAQRTDEQQNSLYAAARQPGFNLDYQTAVQYGPAGIAAYKAKQEADNALTEGQIKKTKLLTDRLALLPEAYNRADTPEAYLKLHETVHSDPVLGPWLKSVGATPEKGLATLQNAVQTGKFDELRMGSMQSVAQLLEGMKPITVSPGASVFQGGKSVFTAPAAPRQPQLLTPEEEAQKARIALASRPPGQPRAEQPLEKVVDPGTGKIIFASRSEALSGKMTPASAMESLSPKEIQKREAALPQATSSVKSIESKSDQFIKELEKLRDDEGLDQITGPVYGRTPSVSRAGSRAQSTYDKIFAKGGFQALQDMREASKTGGALGNVSNEEGRRLEKSIVGGLDRTQNIADVKQGINDLIDEIRVSKARVREAYDSTYSYKSGGGAAPAAAPASNVVVTPDGQSHTFPTPAAAAQFKTRVGIQ
jgi:hypothetical protein